MSFVWVWYMWCNFIVNSSWNPENPNGGFSRWFPGLCLTLDVYWGTHFIQKVSLFSEIFPLKMQRHPAVGFCSTLASFLIYAYPAAWMTWGISRRVLLSPLMLRASGVLALGRWSSCKLSPNADEYTSCPAEFITFTGCLVLWRLGLLVHPGLPGSVAETFWPRRAPRSSEQLLLPAPLGAATSPRGRQRPEGRRLLPKHRPPAPAGPGTGCILYSQTHGFAPPQIKAGIWMNESILGLIPFFLLFSKKNRKQKGRYFIFPSCFIPVLSLPVCIPDFSVAKGRKGRGT